MSDAVFSDDIHASFEDTEGFRVSRFSGAERTIEDARKLFTSKKRRRPGSGFQVKFKTKLSEHANSFPTIFDFRRRKSLPHRMNVVIGCNGTGKTRLLSNLAIASSGYGHASKEAAAKKAAGRFVGTPPPFKKVVVVSYSAFDTFVIPGRTEVEKERLKEEGDLFGYVYCGLRERGEDMEDAVEEQAELALKKLSLPAILPFLATSDVPRDCLDLITDASVEVFEGIEDFEVISIKETQPQTLMIQCYFHLRSVVWIVSVPTAKYESHASALAVHFMNPESSDGLTKMELIQRCSFKATINFDRQSESFDDYSVEWSAVRRRKKRVASSTS